jgi:hypothetical protein
MWRMWWAPNSASKRQMGFNSAFKGLIMSHCIPQWRTRWGGAVWGFKAPPKFRSFDKAELNSQFRGIYIRNNLIRIRVSPICKLSRTPDLEATAPRSLFYMPSILNWICRIPPKKFLVTPLVYPLYINAAEAWHIVLQIVSVLAIKEFVADLILVTCVGQATEIILLLNVCTNFLFCWLCITVHQHNETNAMHFSFN